MKFLVLLIYVDILFTFTLNIVHANKSLSPVCLIKTFSWVLFTFYLLENNYSNRNEKKVCNKVIFQ